MKFLSQAGALLVVVSLTLAAAGQAAEVTSPLSASAAPALEWGTRLDFDEARYLALKGAGRDVVMTGFPLDAVRSVNLELRRFDVMGPGTRVVEATPFGERRLPLPDVVLLHGTIRDEDGAEVYLGFSPYCTNGWIKRGDEFLIVSTQAGETTIGDVNLLPRDLLAGANWQCEVLIPPPSARRFDRDVTVAGAGERVGSIAIETDYEYMLKSGSVPAAEAYTAELMGAMSFIYERDVDTRIVVTYLRLWSTSADPWNQSSSGNQLNQFRSYWNANMTHINRATAHFLSGRGLGGGVAWLGVVCHSSYGYALSGNMNGYFNPDLTPHSSNWDIMVVSHETGHNYGAPHTHDYNPPLDTCGLGCNDPPFVGTIMSYCHICPGGMTNIHLEFHPVVQDTIVDYLTYSAGCDLTETNVNLSVDLRQYEGGAGIQGLFELREPGTVNVLYSDYPSLDASGQASLGALPSGEYDASALWPNWLRRVLPNVVLAAPQTDLSFVLTNGDANFDNTVDLLDINTVLAHFGTSGYVGNLNWDGTVDLIDVNIVLTNFGLTGDN